MSQALPSSISEQPHDLSQTPMPYSALPDLLFTKESEMTVSSARQLPGSQGTFDRKAECRPLMVTTIRPYPKSAGEADAMSYAEA